MNKNISLPPISDIFRSGAEDPLGDHTLPYPGAHAYPRAHAYSSAAYSAYPSAAYPSAAFASPDAYPQGYANSHANPFYTYGYPHGHMMAPRAAMYEWGSAPAPAPIHSIGHAKISGVASTPPYFKSTAGASPRSSVSSGSMSCGSVSCGSVSCGSVSCGSVSCGSVSCGSVSPSPASTGSTGSSYTSEQGTPRVISPNVAPSHLASSTRSKTRNNLPKETTHILLKWLNEHLSHPYPNSFEKTQLMVSTGLNQQQLSNWFINARRRKIKTLRLCQAEKTS